MTRVRDLAYDHTVATFDDRAHPEGVELPSTAPLGSGPAFGAFVRLPDSTFAWLSSTAVWGEDGHPWALVRRYRIDADADGITPAGPGDSRLQGGGELRITDDLGAGLAALRSPTPAQPVRVNARAWPGQGEEPAHPLSVIVQDGITDADSATVTVLSGPGVPSGATLVTQAGLASRLAGGQTVVVDVAPQSTAKGWAGRRAAARLPDRLTIVAADA